MGSYPVQAQIHEKSTHVMPRLTEDEISAAVKAGEITLIALDTSTFDRNALDLEGGRLKLMAQFKDSDVDFLMSDVVLGEVEDHLRRRGESAKRDFQSAVNEVAKSWKVSDANKKAAEAAMLGAADVTAMVDARIKAYQAVTGFVMVDSGKYLNGGALVQAYFGAKPPFKDGEKKKYEFPDAIALLSLEAYAQEQGTMVLCVSFDADWAAFSATSKSVCVTEDLATALEAFQTPVDLAKRFMQRLTAGELPNVMESLRVALEEHANNTDWNIEADSSYRYEAYADGCTVKKISLNGDDFDLVKSNEDELVVEVSGQVNCMMNVSFSLYGWDGIDREEYDAGGVSVSMDQDLDFRLLVTVPADIKGEVEVIDTDVTEMDLNVAVGEVEPYYGDEGEE